MELCMEVCMGGMHGGMHGGLEFLHVTFPCFHIFKCFQNYS